MVESGRLMLLSLTRRAKCPKAPLSQVMYREDLRKARLEREKYLDDHITNPNLEYDECNIASIHSIFKAEELWLPKPYLVKLLDTK